MSAFAKALRGSRFAFDIGACEWEEFVVARWMVTSICKNQAPTHL